MQPLDYLQKGLAQLEVSSSTVQVEQLLAFIEELDKWSKKHNFTKIDIQKALDWHLLDSASALSYCQGHKILDVGTGPGLPGIPLSILAPDKEFYLVDNNLKRITFVRYIIKKLGLKNVHCVHQNIQSFEPNIVFDTILSRAFAQIKDLIELSGHLLTQEGIFIAMKGQLEEDEKEKLPEGYKVNQLAPLNIPNMDSRHILVISRCK